MDWIEIKKECSQAWKLCNKWYTKTFENKDLTLSELGFLLDNQRNLYDFFDEQRIHVTIHYSGGDCWEGVIGLEEDGQTTTKLKEVFKNTRKEAETSAFTKAFEMLEDKL